MATSQDFVNWVCGPELNQRYLRYILMLEQESIRRFAHGTTHQTMYYPEAKALNVLVPDRPHQDAVAEVLGALDDKIAVNDLVLRLAHDLMTALYEEACRAGSDSHLVGEIAEFLNRRRVPLSSREREARKGDVPYYGAAGPLGFVDEPLFDEELVLVGEDGTVARDNGAPVVRYIWRPAWVNNHAHVLRGKTVSTPLLRVALEKSNVAHLVTGAVQPKLSMGNLKSLALHIPRRTDSLEVRLEDLSTLSQAVTVETERLAQTRDELLPLLMSGRVRVKDAEKAVEGVL